jgi:hypothetical protein
MDCERTSIAVARVKLERQAMAMTPDVALVHCYAVDEELPLDREVTFDAVEGYEAPATNSAVDF